MYFDFMRYDEMVTTGSGGPANIGVKSGGLCEEVAQKAFDYVEEKDGFLRRVIVDMVMVHCGLDGFLKTAGC